MARLSLPSKVFVEAVMLTAHPLDDRQVGHPAVARITDWWNANAAPELRCAFAFMFYVRHQQEDWPQPVWFSGCYEEPHLDDGAMQREAVPTVEASQGDNMVLTFWQRSTTTWDDDGRGWCEALDVAGNQGPSGGTSDGFTGEMGDTRVAYDALKQFPSRFPSTWARLLDEAGMTETPRLQRYRANGAYFFIEPLPASASV